jgi:hypothetical protein
MVCLIMSKQVMLTFVGGFIMKTLVLAFVAIVLLPCSVFSQPIEISTPDQLQAIGADETSLAGEYILVNDIDLAGYPWAAIFGFSGTFDGNGHIVKNLTTNNTENRAGGLFGKALEGSVVQNVGVVDCSITSGWYSAALVGDCFGEVSNCFASGGTVTSLADSGNVGSFCGLVRPSGSVTNCYSTADVIFGDPGWANQGGFVGHISGPVTNCYYAGVVTVAGEGGLGGGFFGNGEGTLTSSYFDIEVGGIAALDSAGSTTEGGLTTAEMMQQATYVGWDFDNVWSIDEGQGYPQLQQPTVGPVGYWKLDETSGAIAQDSSGNGYDGILSADPDPAPLWTTDPERGNVLEFMPGLDYVDCGPGVCAGQDLTVALWINPADKELMRPISCFDGADYSANPGWYLMLRHDDWGDQIPPNLWFRITGGVDPETAEDAWNSGDVWINECWAPGEWVHMAFTFDEDTDTLSGYINGELAGVTVVPESRSVASDTNPLIIGHGGGSEEYQGLMDEVYIYDVVLTEAEIWGLVYPTSIPVPNGDFEEIYKPGSDTITADLGDGWTQGLGPDTPMDNGTATYSDGTTGDAVDIPGWIGADPQGWVDNGGTYDRDPNFPDRQGSVAAQIVTPDGLYYYLSNGGDWGNPAGGLIVSDAPLATVEDGLTYTLSMLATGPDGPAIPVVLELLADGVALTPSSSVDPELSGEWQEVSRTYDTASLADHIGKSLTIRLGVGRGASGGQTCLDAVSLSYVQEPIAITVPNGDFEQIYKPGSDTITADLGGGWTQGLGPDAPMDDGIATYSDGTTGDAVDIPGWIGADAQGWIDNGGTYGRDTNFPNRQGSVAAQIVTPDGLYYYLSNGGGWGNPAGGLIVSDAPLGNVEDGTYTLSMLATGPDGPATPVVLELLADGVELTPSSSVDPELSGEWQEFSRTYDAASLAGHLGKSLTIRLGVDRGASGGQTCLDAVSLTYAP